MSLDSKLSGVQSLSNTVSGTVGAATRLAADLGFGLGGAGLYWKDTLQPASWRGIKFGVLGGEGNFGRRNVVHTYPFRDEVWVEDLGQAARRINITGFLVGNDCIAQRDRLIAACEEDGDFGELNHPTYGTLTVNLIGPLVVREAWDKGRMFEISLSFIESGDREFPSTGDSTGDDVESAAASANGAASADFASGVGGAFKMGASAILKAVGTVAMWSRKVQRLINDATNLAHMVSKLSGDFGRFFGGKNTGGLKRTTAAKSTDTVATLIAKGSNERTTAAASIVTLSTAAAAGDPVAMAAAAQDLADSILKSAADPSDGVRLLSSLADFTPPVVSLSSNIGKAQTIAQKATADMLRRAAVVAMAKASANYQPASADDAAALRSRLCDALDIEIRIAGDQGEDATFNALRALRAAVAMDLTKRGAGLPTIVTVNTGAPMPSLALAQRLYRDNSRENELILQSGCIHPAFLPTSFKALSS